MADTLEIVIMPDGELPGMWERADFMGGSDWDEENDAYIASIRGRHDGR
jgi:hypothetical protein